MSTYFVLWIMMAVLFAFPLRMAIKFAFSETGGMATAYKVAAVVWFAFGIAFMLYLSTEHPLPYIHAYVWMGPQQVAAINTAMSAVAIAVATAIYSILIR